MSTTICRRGEIDTEALKNALRKLPREKKELLASAVYELRARKSDPLLLYRERYHHDPLSWATDFMEISLPDYHMRILESIGNGARKIALHGPHGIGKSVFASLIVFWAGSTSDDCKVITTASAWRQLEKYLWPEIHKWFARVNWNKIGFLPILLTQSMNFGFNSYSFAVASDNPVSIEGGHGKRVVYVFDEAKAIPAGTWESAEGAFSTPGDHYHFALSTPGDTSGVFYDICSRRQGYENWKVFYVSPRQAIRGGRMTLEWAREKRKQWGKDNPAYQNRVWGIFAKDSDDAVIPLSWVDLAVARWHAWKEKNGALIGKLHLGVDVARSGSDKTAIAHRYSNVISKIDYYAKKLTMETAGNVKIAMGRDGIAKVDVDGVGAGVVDRLWEQGLRDRVLPVNAGEKTALTDKSGLIKYANVRAAMWYGMRDRLDPENGENICLPDDPLLIGDLVTPRKKTRSDGTLLIESKDDIRARIGRSTDAGDAVVQAFFPIEPPAEYLVWSA